MLYLLNQASVAVGQAGGNLLGGAMAATDQAEAASPPTTQPPQAWCRPMKRQRPLMTCVFSLALLATTAITAGVVISEQQAARQRARAGVMPDSVAARPDTNLHLHAADPGQPAVPADYVRMQDSSTLFTAVPATSTGGKDGRSSNSSGSGGGGGTAQQAANPSAFPWRLPGGLFSTTAGEDAPTPPPTSAPASTVGSLLAEGIRAVGGDSPVICYPANGRCVVIGTKPWLTRSAV